MHWIEFIKQLGHLQWIGWVLDWKNLKVGWIKNNSPKKDFTSRNFFLTLSKVGSALFATYASPSTHKCSYLTSIFGNSIPTLNYASYILQMCNDQD